MRINQLPRVVRFFDAPGPNPWVARLALASKGVDLSEVTRRLTLVDGIPENRSKELLEKNPAGTTPFIELQDGSVIAESTAICRYLDALYPESSPLTGGPTALEKA